MFDYLDTGGEGGDETGSLGALAAENTCLAGVQNLQSKRQVLRVSGNRVCDSGGSEVETTRKSVVKSEE